MSGITTTKSLALAIRQAEWLGTGKQPEITSVAEPYSLAAPVTAPAHPAPAALEHPCSSAASTSPAKTETNPGQPVTEPENNPIDKQATPAPPAPLADVDCIERDNELHIILGDRNYRVRGFDKHSGHDQLKINLMAKRDEAMHLDKLDLYSSKQRQVFINQASLELGVKDEVIKKDLGKVLLLLEEKQSQQEEETGNETVTIDNQDRQAAFELLHDPDLLNRILTDFNQAGVVGEETNKLAGYLSCVSRKLDKPLAVIIQSSSAAGKSSLMESILALMPEEERVQYSAMTGQSLFFMGETNLKHKILAIAEEEGASNASYALKLLQSEGEVTIASTGKDDSTGNLVTKEYKVEGPVMLFLTTTAIDIDEELLNRCLVLTVNESREQTQAIHQAQRAKRTLQGLQNKLEKDRIIKLHRNAQRLLKPLHVINPYADQLTFLDDKTRTRRDHEKYLTLIDTIALLRQYQREIKVIEHNKQQIEYVEVTLNDIETANRIARDVLGKTLDELPPQTRKLLNGILEMVKTECTQQGIEQSHFRFSRRQIRQCCGWGETQTRLHTQRLVDMEYLLVHRGGRGQSFEYELLYNGEGHQGDLFLMGLLDTKQLKIRLRRRLRGAKSLSLAGSSRPQRGGIAQTQTASQPTQNKDYNEKQFDYVENAYISIDNKIDHGAMAEVN